MISKNHRQNHNFQIVYFLIGSCHTPDAAYALLQDLREERFNAIENYKVSKIKEKAKILRAEKLLASDDEADRLDGEADLLEISNNSKTGEVLYNTAVDELKFIDECIEKIRPNCKYKELPDSEACQLMQQEEWKLELIRRAENSLLTTGTIAPDQFDTMRMHPEFETVLMPAIAGIKESMTTGAAWIEHRPKNLLEM
jgi:hypothetical protein